MIRRFGCTLIVALLTACTREQVSLDGRACSEDKCSEDKCSDGYVCNPFTTECAPRVSTDPMTIHDGDACADNGAFVACRGDTCSEAGCRLCTNDLLWTVCSCLPNDEQCQCAIRDCNACDGPEICNGVDDDCNGTIDDAPNNAAGCTRFFVDDDSDGYGGPQQCLCTVPTNTVAIGGDCDDTNPAVHPGADEILNTTDDDCDGNANNCVADCNCGAHLVACYLFESADANVCADGSGNGLNGVITGTPLVSTGKIGSAYTIASPTLIRVEQSPLIGALGASTISAWMKLAGLSGNASDQQYIADVSGSIVFTVRGDGELRCQARAANALSAAGTILPGLWTHVACSTDDSAIRLFVNGDLVLNQGIVSNPGGNSGPFCIGANSDNNEPGVCNVNQLNGQLDQLQIFDFRLTNARICAAAGRSSCATE